jgi:hypothetical protein
VVSDGAALGKEKLAAPSIAANIAKLPELCGLVLIAVLNVPASSFEFSHHIEVCLSLRRCSLGECSSSWLVCLRYH